MHPWPIRYTREAFHRTGRTRPGVITADKGASVGTKPEPQSIIVHLGGVDRRIQRPAEPRPFLEDHRRGRIVREHVSHQHGYIGRIFPARQVRRSPKIVFLPADFEADGSKFAHGQIASSFSIIFDAFFMGRAPEVLIMKSWKIRRLASFRTHSAAR